MEELDILNSIPVECIIYGLTMMTIVIAFIALKRCNYSIEFIIRDLIVEEVGLTISLDMDLSFIFPKIISYIEMRLDKEKKRPTKRLRIALLFLKSKFIQSLIIKYIRTKILPRLIE